MMIWRRIARMLGRDPGEREAKAKHLEERTAATQSAVSAAQRALEERRRVIEATRGAVNAIQRPNGRAHHV